MLLSTEIVLTLLELKGFGAKSVLALPSMTRGDITNMEQLLPYWHTLRGPRYEKFSEADLRDANSRARQTMERCESDGIGIITSYDERFPESLRQSIDEKGKPAPSLVIYYRGDLTAIDKPGVAVIGTREPTDSGVKAGRYFASALAREGFNIVSGLAFGCDTSAHEGALDAGGVTTAFLANGLGWNDIYPRENEALARRIVEGGGVLMSEYKPGTGRDTYRFIERDRLQAALAIGTIAVQTDVNGGTMHAVRATKEARKPLFAVQYTADADLRSDKTGGNRRLIADGDATPLTRATLTNAIETLRGVHLRK